MKKDIEWLNNEVEKRIEKIKTDEMSFVGSDFFDEGYIHGMKDVQAIANQLDEPEVLSQKWISENVEYAYFDMLDGSGRLSSATAIIKPKKLQNLLVPKQFRDEFNSVLQTLPISSDELLSEFKSFVASGGIKLKQEEITEMNVNDLAYFITQVENEGLIVIEKPTIPQFVADWIEEMKQDERPLYSVMSSLMNKTNHTWSVWKSANKNFSEVVAQAWLDGYEVEEEQKYYVLNKNNKLMLRKYTSGVRELDISNSMTIDSEFFEFERFALTEQEIKDYDERYFAFAVKVEELEE